MNTIIGRKLAVPDYPIYPLTPESVPCAPRTRSASKTSGSLRDRRLILPELGYRFTQKITRCWDWQADKTNRPTCNEQSPQILERLCAAPSEVQEVAS
jgi:hypothetical protein